MDGSGFYPAQDSNDYADYTDFFFVISVEFKMIIEVKYITSVHLIKSKNKINVISVII